MEVGIATCANHVGHMLELTSRVRGKRLGFWRMSECGTEKRCAILFLTRCGKESRRLEKNGKTCIPGLGQYYASAAINRDYPMVMATTLVFALLVMGMNLLVDFIHAFLDPRVKKSLTQKGG